MEKVITRIESNKESGSNLNYWLSRSTAERISAVQVLREQYFQFFNKQNEYDESRKRLRRFYKITQQV